MARLSIDLEREVHQKFNALIPWGSRARILRAIIRYVLREIERTGLSGLERTLEEKEPQ